MVMNGLCHMALFSLRDLWTSFPDVKGFICIFVFYCFRQKGKSSLAVTFFWTFKEKGKKADLRPPVCAYASMCPCVHVHFKPHTL